MDRWYEFDAWSRGHREEALREAQVRHLVEQERASREPSSARGCMSFAWASVLSVLRAAVPAEQSIAIGEEAK